MPKISVCIPTYNSAHIISKAINSVLSQSVQDFEIIISDNASADQTALVVASFKDNRIRYFRNDINIGYPANVNKCLDLAQGDYVTILCADDFIISDEAFSKWIEKLNQGALVVHSSFQAHKIDMNGLYRPIGAAFSPLKEGMNESRGIIYDFVQGRGPFGWGWCFDRCLIIENGIKFETDHTMAPDTLFWLALSLKSNVFETKVNEPMYGFCIHDDNMGIQFFSEHEIKIYHQLIVFEDRLYQMIKNIDSELYEKLLKYKYKYTVNEYIGWVRNSYLSGRVGFFNSQNIILKMLFNHWRVFFSRRVLLHWALTMLPKSISNKIILIRNKYIHRNSAHKGLNEK